MGARPRVPRSPSSLPSGLAALTAGLVAAAPTVAAVITYTDGATWQGAVGGEEAFDLTAANLAVANAIAVEPPGDDVDLGDTRSFSSIPPLDTAFTRIATESGVTSEVPFHRAVYTGDPGGDDVGIGGFQLAPVPEPKTAVLLGLGLAGLAAVGSPRGRARR